MGWVYACLPGAKTTKTGRVTMAKPQGLKSARKGLGYPERRTYGERASKNIKGQRFNLA